MSCIYTALVSQPGLPLCASAKGAAFILYPMSTAPHPTSAWSCAIRQPHVLRFQVCCVIIAAFASMIYHPNAGPSLSMPLSSLATVTLQAAKEILPEPTFSDLCINLELSGNISTSTLKMVFTLNRR